MLKLFVKESDKAYLAWKALILCKQERWRWAKITVILKMAHLSQATKSIKSPFSVFSDAQFEL